MPRFRALQRTWISHLGREVAEGEVVTFDPPQIIDYKGRPKVDVEGRPVTMEIRGNLELLPDESPAAAESIGKPAARATKRRAGPPA